MRNREKYRFDDFTLSNYKNYLKLAVSSGYDFVSYTDDFTLVSRPLLWRHDVEFSPDIALKTAKIENKLGIKATYFFQLHSGYYNILTKRFSDILYEIKSLGHDIGLHFDAHYFNINNENDLNKYIKLDSKYFEDIFNVKLNVFSFHNTNPFILKCEKEKYGDLINVYSSFFKKEFRYCSDSTGFWRFELLQDVLVDSSIKKLHVLTHDGMWSDEVLSPRKRVFKSIDDISQKLKDGYDIGLVKLGGENIDDEML